MIANIRPHNERAAAVWGSGGSAYDRVSATIADALDHVVARLNPQPGEKCLDVATGTGWTASFSRHAEQMSQALTLALASSKRQKSWHLPSTSASEMRRDRRLDQTLCW